MDWSEHRLSERLNLPPALTEVIYSRIAEIDAVKHTFSLTNRLSPQILDRLTHSVIITSTGASNRIEGNRLSDEEVEALYHKLRTKSFRSRDEQEVAGYIEMLKRIFASHAVIPISESHILQLHQDMLAYSDKDQRHRGGYKFSPNRVEAKDPAGNLVGVIFDPTPPHLTARELRELIDWYAWAQAEPFKHPLILLANFILEFLSIHPFQDGNGRMSRLLTNLMLLQNGYLFATLSSHEKLIEENKTQYYLALNRTQRTWKTDHEDLAPWLTYIFDIFLGQARGAMHLLENDQIEYLLSVKQLALWKWAQSLPSRDFSRGDAIRALGFPATTVEQIIRKLRALKKLDPCGQGRATRYRLL